MEKYKIIALKIALQQNKNISYEDYIIQNNYINSLKETFIHNNK